MFNEFHDSDFSLHFLQHRLSQFVFVDDLDGNFLAQNTVGSKFDQTWKGNTKKKVN